MAQSAGAGTGPVTGGSPKMSSSKTSGKNLSREMGTVAIIKKAMQGVAKKRFPNRFMSKSGYKSGLSKQEETL